MEKGQIKFRLNNEEATLNIYRSMIQTVSAISYEVESVSKVQIEERLGVDAIAMVIMNFDSDDIEEYDSLVDALEQNEYLSKTKKLE